MRKTSLSEKLILNFLLLGIGAIVLVGFISFYTARFELKKRTYEQLTSLRVLKNNQIESFFSDRKRDIRLIANSADIINSLNQLNRYSASITAKHISSSLPAFRQNRYLIRYLNSCGYYNRFFICNAGQAMIISSTRAPNSGQWLKYEKRPEYLDALYRKTKSSLSTVIEDIPASMKDKAVCIATPILSHEDQFLGIMILEIASSAINAIMVENNPMNGLGNTGETYLVGSDRLMRSNSRFHPNSIYRTRVNSIAVNRAIKNETGTKVIRDYRNKEVLSSFGKIHTKGLEWVLIAEIDYDEAIDPIYKIRNETIFLSIIVSMVLFVFVFFFSKKITKPIKRLQEAANKVGKGDFSEKVEITTHDEIGELTESFNLMINQLKTKNKELKEERKKRIRSSIDGQETERQRLSRELHDGLGQMLIATKLKLETLIHTDRSKFIYTIDKIKEMFDSTINEVRNISNDLMPPVLNEFGLVTALRNLCDEVSERYKVEVTFSSDKISDNLGKTPKTYLYRIAQEALNNIVKHADATRASLSITHHKEEIQLIIADNGKGFNFGSPSVEYGNGIHNMRDRVNLLNGNLKIESAPGRGTTIKITVPVIINQSIE